MKKGKSTYTLQFMCDSNTVDQLMKNYISANGFVITEKKGEQYFRAGDQFMGYKGLTYSISGQTITINAWLDGALGDFPLEQNSLNMMAMNYRNSINTLFQEIQKLNNTGVNMNNNMNFDPNTGQPLNQNINNNQMNFDPNTGQPINQTNVNQFAQTFQEETTKKQEKMCEIGFWLALFGLLCSFMGVAYGVIIYILNFYFASQGLKTRKRKKAIATIVLSIISILVIIMQIASA